jgi:nitroimidazol reductase NimA-like FMN-containing flavoprotein (pyridoxamine 5'-phosphate oxidase superfamily)
MTTDRLGMTVLTRHECLELLRSTEVGRLVTTTARYPEIVPVNFVVDRGTVVFRTSDGTKLDGLTADSHVSFEADGYERDAGAAWSVVIKGHAQLLRMPNERFAGLELPSLPWQAAAKQHFVRIEPVEMSGRRFQVSTTRSTAPEPPSVGRAGQQ